MDKPQRIEQFCREFAANAPYPTIKVSAGGTYAVVSFADRQFVVTEYEDGYSAVEVR